MTTYKPAPSLVGMCTGCWRYNGRPVYPVHHRHDADGYPTTTIPVREMGEEKA